MLIGIHFAKPLDTTKDYHKDARCIPYSWEGSKLLIKLKCLGYNSQKKQYDFCDGTELFLSHAEG
jgi:hypothetical protein